MLIYCRLTHETWKNIQPVVNLNFVDVDSRSDSTWSPPSEFDLDTSSSGDSVIVIPSDTDATPPGGDSESTVPAIHSGSCTSLSSSSDYSDFDPFIEVTFPREVIRQYIVNFVQSGKLPSMVRDIRLFPDDHDFHQHLNSLSYRPLQGHGDCRCTLPNIDTKNILSHYFVHEPCLRLWPYRLFDSEGLLWLESFRLRHLLESPDLVAFIKRTTFDVRFSQHIQSGGVLFCLRGEDPNFALQVRLLVMCNDKLLTRDWDLDLSDPIQRRLNFIRLRDIISDEMEAFSLAVQAV